MRAWLCLVWLFILCNLFAAGVLWFEPGERRVQLVIVLLDVSMSALIASAAIIFARE